MRKIQRYTRATGGGFNITARLFCVVWFTMRDADVSGQDSRPREIRTVRWQF